MTTEGRIRVLVVDDHPVLRTGLKTLLGGEPDMEVVGEAENGDEALKVFAAVKPDVVLMDLRLTAESGLDVAARLYAAAPGAHIVMFSSFTREQDIYASLKLGVCSYIHKNAPSAELLRAIRTAHAGKRYISAEIGKQVVDHIAQDDLSAREQEVLQLMFEGRSNKEIGAALGISDHTVNIHARNVMGKLGANRRTEAIVYALRKGIISVD
jgi:DNA-binding NarL/FixJ family response regulator